MFVGLKQPRGDGERYVTPARAAAKETKVLHDFVQTSPRYLTLKTALFLLLGNRTVGGNESKETVVLRRWEYCKIIWFCQLG